MYELWNHQTKPMGRGDNLSNNDFDTGSQSLKDQKVSLQKWTLSIPPLAQEAASKGLIWGLISPGETLRANVSGNYLNRITSPWKHILFDSAFWKQTFNDTSRIAALFRVTSWCPKVWFQIYSEIKQRQGGFWERKKALVISTYKDR